MKGTHHPYLPCKPHRWWARIKFRWLNKCGGGKSSFDVPKPSNPPLNLPLNPLSTRPSNPPSPTVVYHPHHCSDFRGCCGGSSTASTPPCKHLDPENQYAVISRTPSSSCQFSTSPPTFDESGGYNVVLLDDVGMAMKNRIGELCKVMFQGKIMTIWSRRSNTKKNRLEDQILQEFKLVRGG